MGLRAKALADPQLRERMREQGHHHLDRLEYTLSRAELGQLWLQVRNEVRITPLPAATIHRMLTDLDGPSIYAQMKADYPTVEL